MKRFFKTAQKADDLRNEGYYCIHLDKKPLQTPLRVPLSVPYEGLAELIAKEWNAQEDVVDPSLMPFTQIAITAQDYIVKNRTDIEALLARYLESDLVCYPVEDPPELAAEQKQQWLPLLEWFYSETRIQLPVQHTIQVYRPSEQDLKIFSDLVTGMSLYKFTLFQSLVSQLGSVVLAFAFLEGHIDAKKAFECAKLEEIFFVKHYDLKKHGPDPMQEKQQKALMRDLGAYAQMLEIMKE